MNIYKMLLFPQTRKCCY